jgi:hypothetical protein
MAAFQESISDDMPIKGMADRPFVCFALLVKPFLHAFLQQRKDREQLSPSSGLRRLGSNLKGSWRPRCRYSRRSV